VCGRGGGDRLASGFGVLVLAVLAYGVVGMPACLGFYRISCFGSRHGVNTVGGF
jgi:hypothetical protein